MVKMFSLEGVMPSSVFSVRVIFLHVPSKGGVLAEANTLERSADSNETVSGERKRGRGVFVSLDFPSQLADQVLLPLA